MEKNVIKFRIVRGGAYSRLSGWPLSAITCNLRKAEGVSREKRKRQCDHRGRGCSDVVTSHRMPGATKNWKR